MTTTTSATSSTRAKATKHRPPLNVHQLAAEAMRLSPGDRVLLINQLATSLLATSTVNRGEPRLPVLGALEHLGISLTAEEIDEARREAWCSRKHEGDQR